MYDYWIERYRREGWVKYADVGFRNLSPDHGIHDVEGWCISLSFDSEEDAVEGILAFRRKYHGVKTMRVVDDEGNVLYEEDRVTSRSASPQPQEEKHMGYEEKQPLHIPRADLITALEKNLADEQQKRADAQATIDKRRAAAEEAVQKFTPDELVNLIVKFARVSDSEIPEMVEESQKLGSLKSEKVKVSARESELEKYVRVLKLAADEQIEVAPNSDLYPLL